MSMRLRRWCLVGLALLAAAIAPAQEATVEQTMAGIVDRFCATLSEEQLLNLDLETAQKAVTPEEREVLATRYWSFDANVPVVVSVMRHVEQAVTPYWLAERGFTKTDLTVKNEEYTYEVWQKKFDAGRVGLGINGFDKHRPHYFVSVAPQDPAAKLELTNFFPAGQQVFEMREGSSIYHDWSDLVLTEVPESLKGQVLLPTIRGRAREAQLAGAFRKTPFPSSEKPDQIMLTWTDDPRTTQTIQWRTAASVDSGIVRYREKAGNGQWSESAAKPTVIVDSFLINDRRALRFETTLQGLKPGTSYVYEVGNPGAAGSQPAEFRTAPQDGAPFTFIVLSDTHNRPETGELLADAAKRYPGAAFCAISGDLVGTGQYRDDWDKFFDEIGAFASSKAIVPAVGNHDSIDGLGADLYRALFALPTNGSQGVPPEQSYSFRYGDALFLVPDVTQSIEGQRPWLEEQLKNSDAKWKFAVFHFPPYAREEEYPDIRREWCTLFDKYNVDFAISGHVHYYMRSKPLNDGQPTDAQNGTVYLISVAVPGRDRESAKPHYAEVLDTSGTPAYVAFTVDGKRCTLRAHSADGTLRDEWTEERP